MNGRENFEAIADYLRTELFPDNTVLSQRISLALYREVSKGVPVTASHLGDTLGMDEKTIRQTLADIDPSRLHYDENDNIVAFAGLSQIKAPHRFLCKGHALYTWCVFDALFLPQLLRAEAQVISVCPVTDATITMLVTSEGPQQIKPANTVMSFVRPGQENLCGNLRAAFCNHVNFFASRDIGENWQKKKPGADVLSLNAAFALGRIRNESYFKHVIHEL
jgi:alkylmercury lyase